MVPRTCKYFGALNECWFLSRVESSSMSVRGGGQIVEGRGQDVADSFIIQL